MITWSSFPRVSSSSSFFFFFTLSTKQQAEQRQVSSPREPPATAWVLKETFNLPIILLTSIHLSSIRQLQTPGRKAPTHSDPPTDRRAALYPFPPSSSPSFWIRRTFLWTFRSWVASWTQAGSHIVKLFSVWLPEDLCNDAHAFCLFLKRCLLLHFSSAEKGAITRPLRPESAVHPLFSSSLYLSAVTGVSENTKTCQSMHRTIRRSCCFSPVSPSL